MSSTGVVKLIEPPASKPMYTLRGSSNWVVNASVSTDMMTSVKITRANIARVSPVRNFELMGYATAVTSAGLTRPKRDVSADSPRTSRSELYITAHTAAPTMATPETNIMSKSPSSSPTRGLTADSGSAQ